MGSLFRGKNLVEQYETFSVLASGCRHLAQTCVTAGARTTLSNLADELDRKATELEGAGLSGVVESCVTGPAAVPLT